MKRDKYRNYRDSFWLDVSLEILVYFPRLIIGFFKWLF